MNVLMVLTSHDRLGDTGRKTGFWLEELAAPYYVFKDAGANGVLASPKGGQPPLDPSSDEPASQTEDTRRFKADAEAMAQLASTGRLDAVRQEEFDVLFYPGGHGPLWDLAEDPRSIALIESFVAAGKPVALVFHAPGVQRHVTTAEGQPLVAGRKVTGFTDSEEEAVGLTKVVPFLVEDELKAKGGQYSKGPDWAPYVVEDGLLITGQNPASSAPAARRLLERVAGTSTGRPERTSSPRAGTWGRAHPHVAKACLAARFRERPSPNGDRHAGRRQGSSGRRRPPEATRQCVRSARRPWGCSCRAFPPASPSWSWRVSSSVPSSGSGPWTLDTPRASALHCGCSGPGQYAPIRGPQVRSWPGALALSSAG